MGKYGTKAKRLSYYPETISLKYLVNFNSRIFLRNILICITFCATTVNVKNPPA